MAIAHKRGIAVRDKILNTASELFYYEGIRAVGVDTIVEHSGVAKTSLYRWFPTKDDLIVAFLKRRDALFWEQWERTSAKHKGKPVQELLAQLQWISRYVTAPKYRGCPFITAATEFPDDCHSSRAVCLANKRELRQRLLALAREIKVDDPAMVADLLLMLIDGAYANSLILDGPSPAKHLVAAGERLIKAST